VEPLIPENSTLRAFLDAIPALVFLADRDVRVLDANLAARQWLSAEPGLQLRRPGGDVLHCVFARDSHDGCGTTEACPTCVIRESVASVRPGQPATRRVAHMILEAADRSEDRWFRVLASPLALDGQDLVLLVLEDVTQLIELREVLPVCPGCGTSPRDAAEVLREAQLYLRRHPGHWSTHELCPDCLRRHAPTPWREGPL